VLAQQQSGPRGHALRLIGNEALCERYQLARLYPGGTSRQATERGLWRIATQARARAPDPGAAGRRAAG
jgi:2-dehydro-3-deoxygalactonokinase